MQTSASISSFAVEVPALRTFERAWTTSAPEAREALRRAVAHLAAGVALGMAGAAATQAPVQAAIGLAASETAGWVAAAVSASFIGAAVGATRFAIDRGAFSPPPEPPKRATLQNTVFTLAATLAGAVATTVADELRLRSLCKSAYPPLASVQGVLLAPPLFTAHVAHAFATSISHARDSVRTEIERKTAAAPNGSLWEASAQGALLAPLTFILLHQTFGPLPAAIVSAAICGAAILPWGPSRRPASVADEPCFGPRILRGMRHKASKDMHGLADRVAPGPKKYAPLGATNAEVEKIRADAAKRRQLENVFRSFAQSLRSE